MPSGERRLIVAVQILAKMKNRAVGKEKEEDDFDDSKGREVEGNS